MVEIINDFFFSQNKNYLVNLIFRNEKGTFIDVGANDGIKYSNSFALSKKVEEYMREAHPDYYNIGLEMKMNAEILNQHVVKILLYYFLLLVWYIKKKC